MKIQVKYHSENSKPIGQAHVGEWIDLKTAEEVVMMAGEHTNIKLGVSIALPVGYEAIMAARSSTFKNFGIIQANGIGIIDETYCGETDEWRFSAYATRDVIIAAGSRIAQFRIQKIQGEIEIEEVNKMEGPARGGFGSTGV